MTSTHVSSRCIKLGSVVVLTAIICLCDQSVWKAFQLVFRHNNYVLSETTAENIFVPILSFFSFPFVFFLLSFPERFLSGIYHFVRYAPFILYGSPTMLLFISAPPPLFVKLHHLSLYPANLSVPSSSSVEFQKSPTC